MNATMKVDNLIEVTFAEATEATTIKAMEQSFDLAKYCGVSPAPLRLRKLIAALLILSGELE